MIPLVACATSLPDSSPTKDLAIQKNALFAARRKENITRAVTATAPWGGYQRKKHQSTVGTTCVIVAWVSEKDPQEAQRGMVLSMVSSIVQPERSQALAK